MHLIPGFATFKLHDLGQLLNLFSVQFLNLLRIGVIPISRAIMKIPLNIRCAVSGKCHVLDWCQFTALNSRESKGTWLRTLSLLVGGALWS